MSHRRCNYCKGDLSIQETTKEHLTITIELMSGIASLETDLPGWRLRKRLPAGSYQFCWDEELTCLRAWMRTMLTGNVGDAV